MAIILFVWELPQNIIGFILSIGKERARYDENTYCCRWNGPGSISLGRYIIVSDENALPHEAGHRKQSMMLGPLYLVIIGIPSLIWCILHSCTRLRALDYYSFYTEAWAERYRKDQGAI